MTQQHADGFSSPMLEALQNAVRGAARATKFVHASSALSGLEKNDRSPVTVADWASQAVVALLLARDASTANIPLVGEEDATELRAPSHAMLRERVLEAVMHAIGNGFGVVTLEQCLDAIDSGRAQPSKRFLTLDPVDGTKGFLRREQYAISLGLIEDGRVTAGVVGCPNLARGEGNYDTADAVGCQAFAALGCGAFLQCGDDVAQPIRMREWSEGMDIRACESVESGHSKQDLSAALLAQLGAVGAPARLDSQAKYVVVARGGADVYLRLPTIKDYRECIWDHAAGTLIASEAGALITDVDGRVLDFSQGRKLSANRGIFAGNPRIVARLIDAFARVNHNA